MKLRQRLFALFFLLSSQRSWAVWTADAGQPHSPLWTAIEAAGKETDDVRKLHKMQDAFSNEMSGKEQVDAHNSWEGVVKQNIIAYRKKIERRLTEIRASLKQPAVSSALEDGGAAPPATTGKGR
jgi:hypothetical protein